MKVVIFLMLNPENRLIIKSQQKGITQEFNCPVCSVEPKLIVRAGSNIVFQSSPFFMCRKTISLAA